ncbi:MAG: thiosulfate sulfurtransferase [Bacteroidia bacterium]|jgi:thiosulfate sulfurtransferase
MGFKRISVDEAKALIAAQDVTVIDVRDAGSFEASSITGATHVADHNLQDFVSLTDKEKPLVIYCFHGNSSQGAADYFDGQGFAEVYSMDGGYEAWRISG